MYEWANEMNCAVTVCDTKGIILYMNEKACRTFAKHGDLIGKNLFDCHNPQSQAKIRELLETGEVNAYTIEKNGVRKRFIRRHGSRTEWSVAWWRFRWKYPERCHTI